jgi:hypothetical protein
VSAHRLVPLAAPGEWAAALEGVPHGFTHTHAHCAAIAPSLPDGRIFLYVQEYQRVRLVCPLLERPVAGLVDVATPPGVSGFATSGELPDFPAAWLACAQQRGWVCGYIGLHPLYSRASCTRDAIPYHEIFVLDLDSPLDQLRARLDRNRRRELRTFADTARIVTDRERVSEFLHREYPGFAERTGVPPAQRFTAAGLQVLASWPQTLFVAAEDERGLAEAYVCCWTDYGAEAVLDVPSPGARRYTAALIWHCVTALHALGIPALSLGGGVRADDAIAHAKARFRARRLPLRALKQVYRPVEYAALCREAGVEPIAEGYFPAYRAAGARPLPPFDAAR